MIRPLAFYIPVIGCIIFIVAIALLHLIQPEMSALNEAMSYYIHGRMGWLLTIALLALGFGSLWLSFVINRSLKEKKGRLGRILLFIWSIGVIVGAVFAADPPGDWNRPPSLPGMIHGGVALPAILSFPFAALLISKLIRHSSNPQSAHKLYILAILSILSLVLFAASILPAIISPGPPKLIGLSERVLFATYILWIIAAGYSI